MANHRDVIYILRNLNMDKFFSEQPDESEAAQLYTSN